MSNTNNVLPRIDLDVDFENLNNLTDNTGKSTYIPGSNSANNLVGKQDDQKALYGSEAMYYQKLLNKVPALNLENNNLPLTKTEIQGNPGIYYSNFHMSGISEPVFDYRHNDAMELDDGSILTCGSNSAITVAGVAKFDSFGRVDKGFGGLLGYVQHSGVASLNWKKIIRTKSNDYYLVGDTFADIYIAKFSPEDGSIDTSFGVNGFVIINLGGTESVNDATLQPDGKLLICGLRIPASFVARFDFSTEALDPTFNVVGWAIFGFGAFQSVLNTIKVYKGAIYASGNSSLGITRALVARININGTLDLTFNGTGFNQLTTAGTTSQGWGLVFQSDDKILVSGQSTTGAFFDSYTARVNTNGVLDATYGVAGIYKFISLPGDTPNLRRCAIDKNDNLYAFGDGFNVAGRRFMFLIKVNSNGTLNTSFNNGVGYLLNYLSSTFSTSFQVKLNDNSNKLLLVNYYGNNSGLLYKSIIAKVNI